MKLFRTIIPAFLLALFLFPQVNKGIHDLDHEDDFHCMSNTAHLHEQEHVCSFCDFVGPEINPQALPIFDFILFTIPSYVTASYEADPVPASVYYSPLRAPPAVF